MHQLLNKKNIWFYLLVLTSLVMLTGEVINNRFYMHDFEVYYKTANRFLHGEVLYRIKEDGHFIFKYSPTSAFYFIPLAVLPYSLANVLYWIFLTLLVGTILNTLFKLNVITEDETASMRQKNIFLLLTFLTAVTHFHRELHLGQVNLLLLALYVFSLQSLILKRYQLAGFLLAVSLFIKPFGLIFLPYLVIKNKPRALVYTIVFVVLLGLLPLLFYPSLAAYKQLYVSWFQELAIELKAKQSLLQEGNHTIFSVLARYTPLQYLLQGGTATKIYQLTVLGLVGLSFLYFVRKGRHVQVPMVAEGSILICLIPLFAVTSMNAFLFAVPCIVYMLYHASYLPGWGKVALTVACILIGGNNYDLVGRRVYGILEDNSVYTFGTLLLLALMFYVRIKMAKEIKPTPEPELLAGKTVLR